MLEKEPKDWRELLAWITSDPVALQRIVQELGVRDITIKRWIEGPSKPRSQNLRRLVTAIPEHRERFLDFFAEEYKDVSDFSPEEVLQEIPSRFYTQIFQMRSMVGPAQRYWSIVNAVINQALTQLDSEGLGMAITVVRCMNSRQHASKIWSLRQSIGKATPPWPGNLEQKAMFLAAESLAGYVVSTCRPSEVQSYKDDNAVLLGHQFDMEQSATAYPILYAGRIAGCLLLSSVKPYYFHSTTRLNLIDDFAHLIALAFDPTDFVEPSQIELRMMPPHAEQKIYFSTFRQRLTNVRLRQDTGNANKDAESIVWEELEEEILQQQQKNHRKMFNASSAK